MALLFGDVDGLAPLRRPGADDVAARGCEEREREECGGKESGHGPLRCTPLASVSNQNSRMFHVRSGAGPLPWNIFAPMGSHKDTKTAKGSQSFLVPELLRPSVSPLCPLCLS